MVSGLLYKQCAAFITAEGMCGGFYIYFNHTSRGANTVSKHLWLKLIECSAFSRKKKPEPFRAVILELYGFIDVF